MGAKRKASSTSTPQTKPEDPKPKPESSSEEEEEEEEEEEVEYEEVEVEESESEQEQEPQSSSSDDDDDATRRETLLKLLEPFSKEQIINLLKEAASKDPTILPRVTSLADTDPAHRKIFVHGLGYDATTDQLRAVFQPYGDIDECKLITDRLTGRAKGYAFVLFTTRAAAKRALKDPQKKIGNRNTSCQLAAMGPVGTPPGSDTTGRKIYVGNVGPGIDMVELRAFFGKFGEIEEGPLGFDSVTKKSKGFAIFVFKTAEGFNKALEEPVKVFGGCQLYCKKFVENPKDSNNSAGNNSNAAAQAVAQQAGGMGYGFGMTPGLLGGLNMNAMPLLMGQGMGFGANPMLGLGQTGLTPSLVGAGYGLNSISPGVVGSYGSQQALQGYGAYQGLQRQSSFGGTAATSTVSTPAKDSSGIGSAGLSYSSYFGR